MNILFRLLYATHANGTHHKLAFDALRYLKAPGSEDWRKLFLKHASLYMEGAKAPDKEFKDFKNHVLHVRDNYWGGAADKVCNWYDHLVQALKEKDFERAVYSAGVLSHYYTDPIQPFHTAQSEAENNLHRAVEWSISKSYNDLWKLAGNRFGDLKVEAGTGPDWLTDMVHEGAERSNQYYEKLIAHYDINKGVVDPPAGLDDTARLFIAGLIRYASIGFSRILDHAIADAAVAPPQTSLSLTTIVASLKIPLRWVLNKIEDADERRAVQAAYDELVYTGKVEKYLSEDDRMVRGLYASQVLAKQKRQRPKRTRQRTTDRARPIKLASKRNSDRKKAEAATPKSKPAETMPDRSMKHTPAQDNDSSATQGPRYEPEDAKSSNSTRTPRYNLKPSDDIEAAPSIGAKTAARLIKVGIHRVSDLLAADPHEVAALLEHRYIGADTVREWRDQAKLVCDIPGLRGGAAQLLVGSGVRTALQLAEMMPGELITRIHMFSETDAGKRVLRSGKQPNLEKIKSWIESAKAAPLSKAA